VYVKKRESSMKKPRDQTALGRGISGPRENVKARGVVEASGQVYRSPSNIMFGSRVRRIDLRHEVLIMRLFVKIEGFPNHNFGAANKRMGSMPQ